MISISALLKQERDYIREREREKEISERRTKQQFGMMAAASRVAEDMHQFRKDIWAPTSEVHML